MKRPAGLGRKALLVLVIVVPIGWFLLNFGTNIYEVETPITANPFDCAGPSGKATRFAVIGDYGAAGNIESDVAALVNSWDVDFIVTVGDNNYPDGESETIDENIGQYYHDYIHPYRGRYGAGAAENRFWPALGNHDWNTGSIGPYLQYFTLPGNERYYEFERGPVHLFVLDSDEEEPDGRTHDSVQADWLQAQMAASTAPWRLVFMHHPPYSSSYRRGTAEMRWPFAEWGADAVLAGHDHQYERFQADGIPHFTNGLGGNSYMHRFLWPVPESRVRYNRDWGAQLVTADDACINFSMVSRKGELVDSVTLTK